jgi:hypothetical protein
MRRLANFLALARSDRILFIQALVVLWGITIALSLLPFTMVLRLSNVRRRRFPAPGLTMERIAGSVLTVSRYVPRSTCLTRALAARALLALKGHASLLQLGVARANRHGIRAHAWVECDGTVVVGGPVSEDYSAFPSRGVAE